MNNIEYTLAAAVPGTSQKISIVTPGTAVVTAVLPDNTDVVVVTPKVECFFRRSASANATSDGTDQYLLANNTYRLFGFKSGDRISFNGPTAGDIYITPGA